MSKAGFGELGSKGKLDSLGGHGVNLNIIGYLGNYSKPVCCLFLCALSKQFPLSDKCKFSEYSISVSIRRNMPAKF